MPPTPPLHLDLGFRPRPNPSAKLPSALWSALAATPPAGLRSAAPTEPFRLVSMALAAHPIIKGVRLLGAHWNKSGNIVSSFPFGTPAATLDALPPAIRLALRLEDSVQVSRDVPWSKLMISSVLARDREGSPTYSEDVVHESLRLNPAFADLAITRPPRWIRRPTSITGAHSSLTFSFEDPDGSTARSLLKTPLFAFGAPVTLKRWQQNARDTSRPRFTSVPPRGPAPTDPAPEATMAE